MGMAGVKIVTCEMSSAYKKGTALYLPNAERNVDNFHVLKLLRDAMEKIRRAEQARAARKRDLFEIRRILMADADDPMEAEAERIGSVLGDFPETGMAYSLVSAEADMYRLGTYEKAEKAFDELCLRLRESGLKQMVRCGDTLEKELDGILGYFKDRVTNAISEGLFSVIEAAKRNSRGYHTFEGFRTMICMVALKLKLECPRSF